MSPRSEAAGPLPLTPVVLTHDEEANLSRTLDSLRWAESVLVVDSGSSDATLEIAHSYRNVTVASRPFDGNGPQWAFAVQHPAVKTRYVLALDADMALGPGLLEELERRVLVPGRAGARIGFEYRVGGRALLGSLYPPDVRLFDRDRVRIRQSGHTHRFEVEGPVERMRNRLVHDDRKPLSRFWASQTGYAAREAQRIRRGEELRFRDRLRRLGVMAPLIFLLAYARAGGPLRGLASLRYAHERALYESLLALLLMEDAPRPAPTPRRPPTERGA